jgi:hypothetical protein
MVHDAEVVHAMSNEIIGQHVSIRGINGRITKVVHKGDNYSARRKSSERYLGESFAVVVDSAGRSHHVLLSEI